MLKSIFTLASDGVNVLKCIRWCNVDLGFGGYALWGGTICSGNRTFLIAADRASAKALSVKLSALKEVTVSSSLDYCMLLLNVIRLLSSSYLLHLQLFSNIALTAPS